MNMMKLSVTVLLVLKAQKRMHGPILKDTLPYEEYGESKHILTYLLLLFNLRANLVGISQIRNVYYPALVRDANQEFLGH